MDPIEFSAGRIYPRSVVTEQGVTYCMARLHQNGEQRLGILGPAHDFEKAVLLEGRWTVCPLSPHNAAVLRSHLPWLTPAALGLKTSFGFGDRLGLATPGHIHALCAADPDHTIAPIFAQQSVRENSRTGRTPQQVIDDAMWSVFQEGWRDPWGADADHLKKLEDLDVFVAAGYTFFTIDPGEHVDASAEHASPSDLRSAAEALPSAVAPQTSGLLGRTFDVQGHVIEFDQQTLLRAAVKYARAVEHTAAMYRGLLERSGGAGVELELSVDETDQPTTPAEHLYIASELRRLGVRWVSLAPRYVGRFEKGVDYIGDLAALGADLAVHAAIARQFGPYKLSLHSGSDKFSVYPLAARHTRGLIHVKTAGTSYLEALHTIAEIDPALFRTIYAFARERYETDRATYHVSAELSRAPLPDEVGDADLPGLLDQFDAREILHVTFGSVLTARASGEAPRFARRIMELLRAHDDAYAGHLETHFIRHLSPLCQPV